MIFSLISIFNTLIIKLKVNQIIVYFDVEMTYFMSYPFRYRYD
jgi:hypothetical protein